VRNIRRSTSASSLTDVPHFSAAIPAGLPGSVNDLARGGDVVLVVALRISGLEWNSAIAGRRQKAKGLAIASL